MSKRKKVILVIFIPVLITTITIITYLSVGIEINTGSIFVQNASLNNESIQVTGDTASSGLAYAGYSYNTNGDSLFIKLRYVLANPIHKYGAFNISIKEIPKNIKKVYIQGKETSDIKLVWSK